MPEEFKVTENTGQVFAAFTNTLLHLESAVSIGTNLTFSFWFEDTAEVKVVEVCGSCTNVSVVSTFCNIYYNYANHCITSDISRIRIISVTGLLFLALTQR